MNPEDYNYERFDEFVLSGEVDGVFERFKQINPAGDRAPDGTLTALDDGSAVSLSELWSQGPVVLEFGSFT